MVRFPFGSSMTFALRGEMYILIENSLLFSTVIGILLLLWGAIWKSNSDIKLAHFGDNTCMGISESISLNYLGKING